MGKQYEHLSLEDRCRIARLHEDGQSVRQIAAALDRPPSTISRELRRNRGKQIGYRPSHAHEQAKARRWTGSRLERDGELRRLVLDRLRHGWSPEQIAGRLACDKAATSISHESIYRFIYAQIRRTNDGSWRHYLPRAKAKRGWRGRKGGSPASFIQGRVSIAERPEAANDRAFPGHWEADLMLFKTYGQAILVHLSGVAEYRARGVGCFHLPLGYHPLLEQSDVLPKSKRDLDICVLAAMTDRREEFIAANADFFAARNCHIRFVPIGFAKTETTRSYLRASQRNALLQQTKIMLNVHYSDLPYFEWHRALIAIANRCCLITENCEGFEPLLPGKHFVMAKRDDLTTCCEYYLNHEDERKAITAAAYDFICERFTQKDNCRAFLQQIDTVFRRQSDLADSNLDREAPRERAFVGEPVPDALANIFRHGLQHSCSRRCEKILQTCFTPSIQNRYETAGPPQIEQKQPSASPSSPISDVGTLSDSRAQKKSQEQQEAIFQSIENSRSSSSRPAISVIVTLYNYSDYIGECLKSLEESHMTAIPAASRC